MEYIDNNRQPSQAIAWLGFGIALTLFLLVWSINIVTISNLGKTDFPTLGLYIPLFFIGIILGILALTFSIIGLINAVKHFLKKLPSILGIALCCASLVSIFAPTFVYAFRDKSNNKTELTVKSTSTQTSSDNVVILSVDRIGHVKCYKNDDEQNAAKMYAIGIDRDLETWLQMNGLNKDVTVIIKPDKETEYSYIRFIIEGLNKLEITNYSVKTH